MVAYKCMLALVAFLAASCNGDEVVYESDIHNIDLCDLSSPTLTPLLQTNIFEKAVSEKVLRKVIPYAGASSNPQPIRCLKVTNLDSSEHGGYPTLVKGAIGSYDAEILLTSQKGKPLNFKVEIWGPEK